MGPVAGQREVWERLEADQATKEQREAAYDTLLAIGKEHGATCVSRCLALGAILAVQISCDEPQDVPGLHEASLPAVRPKLVGAIAEYADRVLAQDGEKSA